MKTHLLNKMPHIFCILLVLITGCNKEDLLKSPVPVSFSLKIDSEPISGTSSISFDSATIILSNFTVIGNRTVGTYEFTRDFPLGLLINLDRPNAFSQLKFDLPQGKYENITVRFEASELYVRGHLILNPQKMKSTIHLKLNKPKQFEINITNASGEPNLNFQEAVAENPEIIFKPKLWFKWIPDAMFENATILNIDNQGVMRVGENDNILIFDIVNHYIGSSTQCFIY